MLAARGAPGIVLLCHQRASEKQREKWRRWVETGATALATYELIEKIVLLASRHLPRFLDHGPIGIRSGDPVGRIHQSADQHPEASVDWITLRDIYLSAQEAKSRDSGDIDIMIMGLRHALGRWLDQMNECHRSALLKAVAGEAVGEEPA